MSENQQQSADAAMPGETKYTPEQIAQMRSNMIKHYKNEITFLKTQAEFEKLQADIEDHRARRYSAMAHQAQLFQGQEGQEDSEGAPVPPMQNNEKAAPASKPQKERKLKVTKE
jgi:hypothetical protein